MILCGMIGNNLTGGAKMQQKTQKELLQEAILKIDQLSKEVVSLKERIDKLSSGVKHTSPRLSLERPVDEFEIWRGSNR
jgi:hypothetical protein